MPSIVCDLDIELWKFRDIYFDEGPHLYTDSLGTKYTSVTTFVKHCGEDPEFDKHAMEFQEKFGMSYDDIYAVFNGSMKDVTTDSVYKMLSCKKSDIPEKLVKAIVSRDLYEFCDILKWQGIAQRYADKHNMAVADVQAEWDLKKNIAADMGTQVHSYMENLWKRKHYRPEKPIGDYEKKHKVGLMAYEKLRRRFVPVRNELIVYDREWAVCGTIDFLCWDKGKGCLAILDWKTNAKIDRENPYQTCIGPLRGMPDCNYTHYSAQLSLYKAIVERNTELRIGELALVHIGMDDWEYIPCVDRSVEIRVYLDKQVKHGK